MTVGDVMFVAPDGEGPVRVMEQYELFDVDEYDEGRVEFDVWSD